MSEFYVYIHRRASDNLPFYVGKGKDQRAWWRHGRSNFWNNVKNKHGFIVEIVFENLSEEDAFQCEIDTIMEFKYFGYPLVNLTDGGEGPCGRKPTETTKLKMSISQQSSPKAIEARKQTTLKLTGRILTNTHKEKIALANRGKSKSLKHKESIKLAKHCNIRYVFQNITSYEIFVGTRYEFGIHSNIDRILVSCLFGNRPARVSKGWRLLNPPNNLQIITKEKIK